LRGQKDRDKRPEASLHVGDKKDEPIKPEAAAPRGRQRWLRRAGLLGGRRSRCVRAAVVPFVIVARAA
jgi:hypothetical protein